MIAVLVLVSEKKPDEVWMTFVSATKSLENFDLSLVFFSLLRVKCFDSKVLFISSLVTSKLLAKYTNHWFGIFGMSISYWLSWEVMMGWMDQDLPHMRVASLPCALRFNKWKHAVFG